ncbi:MAG: hypothetical protein Fur0032_05010 [Terrimicrobiaceae bacterium]
MHSDDSENAPVRATVAEIERLRAEFRDLMKAYTQKVDGEFAGVQAALAGLASRDQLPGSLLRDLRDMLTVLRNTQIKPGKARRKDIKKLESVAEDLRMLTESW